MKRTLKHAVAAVLLVLSFVEPVAAGPLEDADAALKRRDYATALRFIRPLAGARGRQRPVQSWGLLRQRPGCPAGQGPRIHVVQLVGGARQRRCGSFSRPYRTSHDPRADRRGAEARTRVEAEYAVAFSLETRDGSSYELITRRLGFERRVGRAPVGRPIAPMRRTHGNRRLGFRLDPAANNATARKRNRPHTV